jgi:predicted ATPase/DNA-binding SARP family transcriptional activator
MLEVTLLGQLKISLAGQPVLLSSRPAQLLLAYLLLNRGVSFRREQLAGVLWPETNESRARKNLRNAVWHLRKALGDQYLLAGRETLALNGSAPLHLDVAVLTDPRAVADAETLQLAVAAYQGELLPGFYEDWVLLERERLRSLYERRAAALLEALFTHARWEEMRTWAEHWIALGGAPEPAYRALMLAHAAQGDMAGMASAYQRCVQALETELGVGPSAETRTLYERLARGEGGAPPPPPAVASAEAPARRHKLPAPATAFVGREAELEALRQRLTGEPDSRLLTLTGPGGAGKTRLALAAAEAVLDAFPDGVFFVQLAPLTASEQVVVAVADQIGLPPHEAANRRRELLDYLRGRRMLLVLDNAEHLLDDGEVVRLLSDIQAGAPEVKLLVTSRARLNARAEQLFPVTGLEIPPRPAGGRGEQAAAAAAYSAVRLFVQSAARVRPGFRLSEPDLPAVVRICELVLGLPLALELAAAWMELLTPAEIAAELARSLDFLAVDWPDLPERQRSLRAVFESSWQLLTESERATIEFLAMFQGSFTPEAAQVVARAGPRALLALANKSWVQRGADGRYQVHELLRQYAAEKLGARPGAWRQARQRHADYYANFLRRQAGEMRGPAPATAFDAVALEFSNLQAAWSCLVQAGRFDDLIEAFLPGLFHYCEARVQSLDLLRLVGEALRAGTAAPEERAILLTVRAAFFNTGDPIRLYPFALGYTAASLAEVQQAWEAAGAPPIPERMGAWGALLGYLYGLIAVDQGADSLRRLLPGLRSRGVGWDVAFSLGLFGCLLLVKVAERGHSAEAHAEARAALEEALALCEAAGNRRETGLVLRWLGVLSYQQRRWPEARRYWEAAQTALRMAGDWSGEADIHWQLGDLCLELGEHEAGLEHFHAMGQAYLRQGHPRLAGLMLSKESFEALRYSSVEHAWKLRLASLDVARQLGDRHEEAWNQWELGEIHRVAGDAAAAREAFDRAMAFFQDEPEGVGLVFYHRGLADLALAAGDHAAAHQAFAASLAEAQRAGHEWSVPYALAGLSRAALGLGQPERAREHALEALRLANRPGRAGLALVALVALAAACASLGQAERAAELSGLVLADPASWNETRAQAAALLARLDLPAEPLSQAVDRGRGLARPAVVTELLVETQAHNRQ